MPKAQKRRFTSCHYLTGARLMRTNDLKGLLGRKV